MYSCKLILFYFVNNSELTISLGYTVNANPFVKHLSFLAVFRQANRCSNLVVFDRCRLIAKPSIEILYCRLFRVVAYRFGSWAREFVLLQLGWLPKLKIVRVSWNSLNRFVCCKEQIELQRSIFFVSCLYLFGVFY